MTVSDLTGVWSYRAFLNDPDLERPFNELRFATARLELEVQDHLVTGRLAGEGWGTWIDWSRELSGKLTADGFELRGENVIEGEHWVYDYAGAFAPSWLHADEPRDVLVGSVIRTLARASDDAAAGKHATFIAVRR